MTLWSFTAHRPASVHPSGWWELASEAVLTTRVLVRVPGLTVAEVRCTGEEVGWSPEEAVTGFAVVLVRSGLFRRRVDGVEAARRG